MKNGPYEFVVAPKEYPGKKYRNRYCYEHHFVFWQVNGFVPAPGFEIHHINGDHRDNRIENLRLLTAHEHRIEHGKQRTQKATISFNCGWCKKEVLILRRDHTFRLRFRKKLFCSRSCGARNQFSRVLDK